MKIISSIFFIVWVTMSGLLKAEPVSSTLFTSLTQLTDQDYDWIGAEIYQNEAASNPKYLTHWGKGEDFPSFGIGHFIWFPKEVSPPFKETFPAMLQFVAQTSPPPNWLQTLQQQDLELDAPWQSKAEFDVAQSLEELSTLRQWLLATKAEQARFIVLEFEQRWQRETAQLAEKNLEILNRRLQQMMGFKQGLFSVIDYFNFKGLGSNPKEQYQGESWGLISVLEGMPQSAFTPFSPEKGLNEFIESAKKQLKRRTELAPIERNESRWIPGWYSRLEGYRQP